MCTISLQIYIAVTDTCMETINNLTKLRYVGIHVLYNKFWDEWVHGYSLYYAYQNSHCMMKAIVYSYGYFLLI